jgi:purine-binding chemotaxis protein CheW
MTEGLDRLASLDEDALEVLRRRADALSREAEEEVDEARIGILTFRVEDEWYAVRIRDVREIHNDYVITPVPSVPEHVLGVINIRGEIVSVTDLARILGLGSNDSPDGSLIVVGDDDCVTALVVTSIGDIVDVSADGVEPPLSVGDRAHAEYVVVSVSLFVRLIALIALGAVLQPIGVSE